MHMRQVFQRCKVQQLWHHEGFHPDSGQGVPERAAHEALGRKPKIQWRLQEIRDARNIECLVRKAEGNEQSQPKKKEPWARMSKATQWAVQALRSTHPTTAYPRR